MVIGLRLDGDAFTRAFRADGRIEVVAVVGSSEDAVHAVDKQRPQVVLLHVSAREGLAIAHRLKLVDGFLRLVVCGVGEDSRELAAWGMAGVLGYVDREASFEELVTTIVSASQGIPSGSASLLESSFRRAVLSPRALRLGPPDRPVTRREQQVLELIARGLSNKQIAGALSVEVATIKNHLHSIFRKLEVQSRAEAVARWEVLLARMRDEMD